MFDKDQLSHENDFTYEPYDMAHIIWHIWNDWEWVQKYSLSILQNILGWGSSVFLGIDTRNETLNNERKKSIK